MSRGIKKRPPAKDHPEEVDVDDLLDKAGLTRSEMDADARQRMAYSVGIAKWMARVTPLPTLKEHNAPLLVVRSAAGALLKALSDLDRHGEPSMDFWRSDIWGEISAGGPERKAGVFDNIRDVEMAAALAIDVARLEKGQHRPKDQRTQNIVDHARNVLVGIFKKRGARFVINGNPNGRFAEFARALFEAATGHDPLVRPFGIDKQIRAAAKAPRWVAETTQKRRRLTASRS